MQQEYKYIYQVYLDGNFSRAAEHLYMTQPALSIAVRKVEESIGMPLFERSVRPFRLTEVGRAYIDMIREIRYLEEDVERKTEDIRDLSTGRLRLGGSHYINAYILPEIFTGFSRAYPGIRLELVEESAADLPHLLTNHEVDLTFNCTTEILTDFRTYPAFRDHVLLAVPQSFPVDESVRAAQLSASDILNGRHLEDSCPSVSLNSFRSLEFILLSEGNNLHDRSLHFFADAGFTPQVKLMVSQLVTAWHLADSQFAATFIADHAVVAPSDRLNYYRIDSEMAARQFYILLPKKSYISHAVKAFIRFFAEQEKSECCLPCRSHPGGKE